MARDERLIRSKELLKSGGERMTFVEDKVALLERELTAAKHRIDVLEKYGASLKVAPLGQEQFTTTRYRP